MSDKKMDYGDYLKLELILSQQTPKTAYHDENLFIIAHQAGELWFKLILIEFDSICENLSKPELHREYIKKINLRLVRIKNIFKLLESQFDVLDTMLTMDFLDFREALGSSSGFQSKQFRLIEEKLNELVNLIDNWLCRMPYLNQNNFNFWEFYPEAQKIKKIKSQLSHHALGSALMIYLYQDQPGFTEPNNLLQNCVNLDTAITQWRQRHAQMVECKIGSRMGTGGTLGAEYLKQTAAKPGVFYDLLMLSNLVTPRSEVPALPSELAQQLQVTY